MFYLNKTKCKIFLISFISLVLACLPAFAKKALDFTLKDLDGNLTKLSEYYHEHIILIDFWATWCLPCLKELPHFQKLHEKYKEKGLKVLAISVDSPESIPLVNNFMKRYKYNFPVLLDTESKVVSLYNPRVILPYTILIDREGKIRYTHQGYSPGDESFLEEKIVEMLEQKDICKPKIFAFHLSESFLSRTFLDKDYVNLQREGRTTQIINQFDLSVSAWDFILGLRFDTDLDFSPVLGEIFLAKRYIEYNTKKLSLRLGDFYHSTGRGLLLSVLKVFEKEGLEYLIDTTLDGGKVSLHMGAFSAQVFGGWIKRQDSELKDKLFSGSIGWRIKNTAQLQVHYLYSQLAENSTLGNKAVQIESISLDIPKISESAKFYGEFCLIQKQSHYSEKIKYGYGIYLESGFFLGKFSFLLEFKNFKNLDFEYNRPPLLESEQLDILANQFDTEAVNITGIAGRIDYFSPKISTLIYGKLSYIHDNPDNHPFYGKYKREIFHFFTGVEKKFKTTGYIHFLAGYRRDSSTSLAFFTAHGKTYHYQGNLSYPLSSRLSLEVDWKSKDFKGRYIRYYERRASLSLHASPVFIISAFLEVTNDPEILAFKNKKYWWAGQIEVKLFQSNSIRIFFGSTKGGVKCSGGACQFFPPFEGIRIEAIIRL